MDLPNRLGGSHMNSRAIVACILVISSPASAKRFYVAASAKDDQVGRFENGVASVESIKGGSVVRLKMTDEPVSKRIAIQIGVANRSQAAFNVGPENVTVSYDGTIFQPAISYEQLAKEERNRRTWAAVAAGLSAMSNSMAAVNAGNSYGTYRYSGTTYGSYGSTTTFGSGTVSTYNAGQAYAAQQLANLRNDQIYDNLAARNSAGLERLKENLRTTTIDPAGIGGGLVTLEIPRDFRKKEGLYTVKVLAGTDEHLIQFRVNQR